MNKLLLLLISLTLIGSCNNQEKVEYLTFKPLIDKDILNVSKIISDLDTIKKSSDWVDGDRQFYKLWLKGAKSELQSDFKTAIRHYNDALNVKRYELSTFEVKLPLGRALIENGNSDKAYSILKEFKNDATNDLNTEDVEWGLSEEGKIKIKKDIELCDSLLSLINK
jgi:hypothetical protein